MILVQNHLRLLSGNKLWCLIFACFCLSACSPRIRTGKSPKKPAKETTQDKKEEKKFTEAGITLMMPLKLNTVKATTGTKADLEQSAMSLDFYQGFKMGIDSAAAKGMNFKLTVLDTRDDDKHLGYLIGSDQLKGSNLIVGPVFPDGLKYMSAYSIQNDLPMVSPLAASQPAEFNNPNLISLVNNIDLHAEKIGQFISKNYEPSRTEVVLISTKKPADELLAVPFRSYFTEGRGNLFHFSEYSSVFSMESQMVAGKKYLVLVTSADRAFVVATIDKLAKMKLNGSQLELFGHPNWSKQNYNTEKLQSLKTRITTSYYVDYKNQDVIRFIRNYRRLNQLEPGEFAFKGFDTGYYFGMLFAAHGSSYLKYLTKTNYKGLQNSFHFIKDEKLGYINTSLFLLEFKNYALTPVE
ncbi:amino acid ABC transporter substrate-binding protein [Pedobacter antarcticus]|uniref:amino acid ABC transporter substrate-binding protein n=1 Tax=Pedobacter antarcticus TaxID=34086 RepID=UPI00292CD401|nr:amino acid ABC transporter substrate-binding protein [Pedobacter antarcticus]